LDDVVIVPLGELPPTLPNPTAKAIIAAPPNSEIAFVASVFMSSWILRGVVLHALASRGANRHRQGFGHAKSRQTDLDDCEICRMTLVIAQIRERNFNG
jgi:hypothetical protein